MTEPRAGAVLGERGGQLPRNGSQSSPVGTRAFDGPAR